MVLPDKVKFLCVAAFGHAEYWFRNDVWELISRADRLKFLDGMGFQQIESELQRRKLKFEWRPKHGKFVDEPKHPHDVKYNHMFNPPNPTQTPHL